MTSPTTSPAATEEQSGVQPIDATAVERANLERLKLDWTGRYIEWELRRLR